MRAHGRAIELREAGATHHVCWVDTGGASSATRLEVTGASRLVQRMWPTLAFHGRAPVTSVGAPA